jgi:3-deoxy-D-manno-octulosonate cytidylyltransferase
MILKNCRNRRSAVPTFSKLHARKFLACTAIGFLACSHIVYSPNHLIMSRTLKKVALIPARLAATRFPQKLLQPLGGKTVIATVHEAVKSTALFDDVIVVTDSDAIYTEIENRGGHVVMSTGTHESGTDRIAEAAATMDVDVIVNVQGDTPFIERAPLEALLQQFDDETVQVASIMQRLTDAEQIGNPNVVKVCVDKQGNALYFSRAVIPYPRDAGALYHITSTLAYMRSVNRRCSISPPGRYRVWKQWKNWSSCGIWRTACLAHGAYRLCQRGNRYAGRPAKSKCPVEVNLVFFKSP